MDIHEFFGEYRFLSNFYPATFVWKGILWPSSEHAYQAAKTLDRTLWLTIAKVPSPGSVKRVGKQLILRDDWETVKYDIMLDIVRHKFKQNPDIAQKLLDTGTAHLEEGNTWGDRVWGVCPPRSGDGQNWLGHILMTVREEMRCDGN